jgi:L-methionine (R)-S-oxide reductase
VTLDVWLRRFVSDHGGVAGTVHTRTDDVLTLAASLNIPPPVVQKTRVIPKGKGMAGLAWSRDQIVSTCDLKADQTGDVQPGAKAVDAQAAAAIPVHDDSGGLRAVVGIAFMGERDFTPSELAAFANAAESLPGDG